MDLFGESYRQVLQNMVVKNLISLVFQCRSLNTSMTKSFLGVIQTCTSFDRVLPISKRTARKEASRSPIREGVPKGRALRGASLSSTAL